MKALETVRLVDYGVAKQHKIGREECDDSAGTEWWMSPESFLYEMVDGEKKVIPFNGFLSDVWALGIIYFQLVAVNINGLSLHPLLTPAEQKTVNQDTNDRFSIAERMETLESMYVLLQPLVEWMLVPPRPWTDPDIELQAALAVAVIPTCVWAVRMQRLGGEALKKP